MSIPQLLSKAIIAHKKGKSREAERFYRQILKFEPTHADSNHNLGVLLLTKNNVDDALYFFKTALDNNPNKEIYWTSYINLLINKNKFDEAEALSRNAIKLKPEFFIAHYNLGRTLIHLGKLDEAKTSLEKAIMLKPDFFEAHVNMGVILYELGKLDEAISSYKRATELNSGNALLYNNLANTLKDLNRPDEAISSYKKAIVLDPNLMLAHYNLGISLQAATKLDEAEASYRKAIELKPDFADAYNNLAVVLKEKGNLHESIIIIEKTIKLKPDYATAYNNLGNLFKQLGRLEEAELNFKKTLELDPNFTKAHHNLGMIFYEKELFQKATEHFILSDTVFSKLFLLKCFFILDQQSNFYNHLDSIMDKGINNALIGNLISSAKIKYGIDKPNPFCNDPLNYVSKTDLITQCNFKDIFIKGATDILTSDKIQNRKQGLLTNGIQTAGNIFTQGGAVTNEMQKIIYAEVEKYKIKFKDSDEGFLKKWPTNYQINGWIVSMKSGGNLSPHMHEMGWISGSVYINVPPKSEIDSGNLVVCIDEASKKSTEKQYKKSLDVVTGSLCLFPSSLLHYTIPFEAEEDRIVLAFDIIRDIEKNI
jgi:tetratricopeptide (TPR) repeat protein